MFHSPQNGIGIKRSSDLRNWSDVEPLVTLGQDGWEWAKGRITAGFVLDCRSIPSVGKYIMFFHGSGPLTETEGDFDKNSSIGIAWSDDLQSWALRRRIAGTLLSVALLIAVPMIYSALLPHSGTDSMVACNLDGQEEAVIQCANKLLT